MSLENEIEAKLGDPKGLETLFRASGEGEFREAVESLRARRPDEPALAFWEARLEPGLHAPPERAVGVKLVFGLAVLGGLYAKLPAFLPFLDEKTFYSANAPFFVFLELIALFLLIGSADRKRERRVAGALLACAAYANVLMLCVGFGARRPPDTLILAAAHMPLVLWSLLGKAFDGGRIKYLSFWAETAIFTVLILAGGAALTGLSLALFSVVVGHEFAELWMEWIALWGAVAAPLVGASLVLNKVAGGARIAPVLARIFSPLLLVTLVFFLLAMAASGKNPYTDRENLIVYNAMLIAVLIIVVLGVVERSSRGPGREDELALGLVGAGLLINAVALSAVLYRLASLGLTPNRAAGLGANVLVFAHAATIAKEYLGFIRGRTPLEALHAAVSRFLPAYAAWSCVVVFLFPALFRFK